MKKWYIIRNEYHTNNFLYGMCDTLAMGDRSHSGLF